MSFPRKPLLMRPTFSARPWGGTFLKDRLGKPVPEGERIGESWELSDHPNGRSTVATEPFTGKTFGELLAAHPVEMIGVESAPERYPLLVKIIDAAEDLSIQVHPNDEQAARSGDRGKTECWYIIDCEPGTEVIYGVAPGVTADQMRAGALDGSIEGMVARHPLEPGQFLYVAAGTVHAILGGTLLCEVQQSSDTTYRLWDWNREPKRELHVEESLDVIDWKSSGRKPFAVPPVGALTSPVTLTDNEFFHVRVLDVLPGEPHVLPEDLSTAGTIFITVAGEGRLHSAEGSVDLALGAVAFLPSVCQGEARAEAVGNGPWRVLLAESRELDGC